jgi:hypothetical protein
MAIMAIMAGTSGGWDKRMVSRPLGRAGNGSEVGFFTALTGLSGRGETDGNAGIGYA